MRAAADPLELSEEENKRVHRLDPLRVDWEAAYAWWVSRTDD